MRIPNVVFCLRKDYREHPGGDIVQMESWAKVLSRNGTHIRILSGAVTPAELNAADLVFVWHLERLHESFQPWDIARRAGLPVVLVPTYWPKERRGGLNAWQEQGKLWIRRACATSDACLNYMLFHSWRGCRRQMLKESALMIANSMAEKNLLIREGATASNVAVIPNVIDSETLPCGETLPWEKRDKILCVGHFCPRKNQLGLIRALKGSGMRVIFVGMARPMHRRYLEQCIRESGKEHLFCGALPHTETLKLLAESRLSICPSFAETPGIGNLEAAALGCTPILPDLEPVTEYFGNFPIYINPGKIEAEKIRQAWDSPPAPELSQRILTQYTESNLNDFFQKIKWKEHIF